MLIIPIVLIGMRTLHTLDPVRRTLAIALRVGVLLLLVMVLAGLRTRQVNDDLTVVALVDVSESVLRLTSWPDPPAPSTAAPDASPTRQIGTADAERRILDFLRQAAQDQRTGDRLGVVTYDNRSTTRRMPSLGLDWEPAAHDAPRLGTNTARAIERGLNAKQHADSALRLVLVSDGNDTAGDALAAARAAKAAGVPIDVLALRYRVVQETLIEGVYTPVEARRGQTVPVRIVLRATVPAAGQLFLRHDDRVVDLSPNDPSKPAAQIQPADWRAAPQGEGGAELGRYILVRTLDRALLNAGPNRFVADFIPDDAPAAAANDTIAANNQGEAFTLVSGQGRVLLVDNVGGNAGQVLANTLGRKGVEHDVVSPSRIPRSLRTLQRYDAVIFQNVPQSLVPGPVQDNLVRYVHNFGGGFIMLGGDSSFGAGAWTNTDIDKVLLPVTCEVPNRTQLPSGALVLVIDSSGSMFSKVAGTDKTQLDVASESAVQALETLYEQDLVGVIAFGSTAVTVVDLNPNTNPQQTARAIRSIKPGGGTDIQAGLQEAYNQLNSKTYEDTALRHVILLTDGMGDVKGTDQLLEQYHREGISLTAIGIGDGQNEPLLKTLALQAAGQPVTPARLQGDVENHEAVTDPNRLPQVFIKQAQIIRRNLIKQVNFVPSIDVVGSPIMAGITQPPALGGLVVTGERDDGLTFIPMRGPEGEPVFAHRQVGLGRSAAFTSDATSGWGKLWLDWEGYADFWKRTVDYVSRPAASRGVDLTANVRDGRLHVRLDAAGAADLQTTTTPGAFANQLTAVISVNTPDGRVLETTLEQSGPGLYEAQLPAGQPGHYIVSMMAQTPTGQRVFAYGGANTPPGLEMRRFESDAARLEQIAYESGGRVLSLDDPAAAGLFARTQAFLSESNRPLRWKLMPWLIALLLLDVANRRIAWHPRETLTAATSWLGSLAGTGPLRTQTAGAPMDALRKAKDSAAHRQPANTPEPPARDTVSLPNRVPTRHHPPVPSPAPVTQPTPKPSEPATEPKPAQGPTTSRLLAARKRAQDQFKH